MPPCFTVINDAFKTIQPIKNPEKGIINAYHHLFGGITDI